MAVDKRKGLIARRPAESLAVGSFAGLTGLLVAFGVDPDKAAALSGAVAALVPMVTSFVIDLKADYTARKAEAEAILAQAREAAAAAGDIYDDEFGGES